MADDLDYIARFAKTKNFNIKSRTVFVEGTTDVQLFNLAAQLEKEQTGLDLLGENLAIIAAGEGDYGGTKGVCRELVCFKNMAGGCLLPNGKPKYRFVGLFDNDDAGRRSISDVRKTDTSILEYRDTFRLHPVMPLSANRDLHALERSFLHENELYKGLDWEIEDLLSKTLIDAFLVDFPNAVIRTCPVYDKLHRDWTPDGKARFHRFVKENAIRADLIAVIDVLKALWHYLNIKPSGIVS